MSFPRALGLRIDVDTADGARHGLPPLLQLLSRYHARATLCIPGGLDRSALAFSRLFTQKGYAEKILRTRAWRIYARSVLTSALSSTSGRVLDAIPNLSGTLDSGHELAAHGFGHTSWHNGYHRMSLSQVRSEMQMAVAALSAALAPGTEARARAGDATCAGALALAPGTEALAPGTEARVRAGDAMCAGDASCESAQRAGARGVFAAAAPGWQAGFAALAVADELGFSWCSDTRGVGPFVPRCCGIVFRTPQVPTTLPTLDELPLGLPPRDRDVEDLLSAMESQRFPVFTAHAELEGKHFPAFLERLLTRCTDNGVEVMPLGDLLALRHQEGALPVCDVAQGTVPGRPGLVAVQVA
jgi:peptidoglycan/xylan/chitin deacetylase (PgdA/CDA1 family)